MKFNFKNPNSSLVTYGIILLIINLISYQLNPGLLIGLGIIIKVLVLLWIPRAASMVGRNPMGWTILCFIFPSVGLTILGSIGYKNTEGLQRLFSEYARLVQKQEEIFEKQVENRELEPLEMQQKLNEYIEELQEFAKEQISTMYDTEDESFLTEQLEKNGYVLNDDSDIFVDVNEKCPACGAKLTKENKQCPDCGLNLYPY
jgi:rubrerythrin